MRPALLAFASLAAACADAGAHFSTQFVSDFAPGHQSVSVLGVYKDGRMSSESWEQVLGPVLSPSLGAPNCEAAYSSARLRDGPDLSAAVDDYARADGPTDDLLALLAPAAKGDLIVVITVAGHVPVPSPKSEDAGAGASSPPAMGGGGRGGMGGRRGGRSLGGAPASTAAPERSTLETSALLYSVRQHRTVGLIAMQYDGPSFDDAVAKFAQKLTTTMPATTCVGWSWDAPIDPQRIRDAADR